MTTALKTGTDLAGVIHEEYGENVFLCYQCMRCSSGCPVAEHMDLLPNQVMRAIQFNDEDVLEAKTPWVCAACQTCTTHCPQELDIAGIMDALRIEARRRGIKPPVREVELFTQVFLRDISIQGRLYEAGLIAAMNMLTLQPFKDVMDLGLPMIRKGKIGLFPKFVRPPKKVQRVEAKENAIAYYPGCSLDSTATEFDHTFRAVCDALDLELVEPHGWLCCGSSPAHTTDPVLAGYYSILNLSLVERMGMDQLVAPCLGCYQRFKAGAHEVAHDAELAAKVADKIGYEYQGTVETFQTVDALLERVGIDGIHERVTRPLEGLKVASYYGCATTRPPKYTGSGSPENPTEMEEIVRALGAEPVDWSYKTDCCGGSLGISQTPMALELSAKVIRSARDSGADIMINACPLCQVNVESRQVQMDLGFEMPSLYITQLMTLAFGLGEQKAELNKNMIDPRPVLRERGILK